MSLLSSRTALLLIDLQNALLARSLAPFGRDELLGRAVRLAKATTRAGGLVVRVKVEFSQLPTGGVDIGGGSVASLPAEALELAPEIEAIQGPIVVKTAWGAFHGTRLDQLLVRSMIETVAVAGIATNFGVESTVREAWQYGFNVIVAKDACASVDANMHDFAITRIFPLLSRVRTTDEIVEVL